MFTLLLFAAIMLSAVLMLKLFKLWKFCNIEYLYLCVRLPKLNVNLSKIYCDGRQMELFYFISSFFCIWSVFISNNQFSFLQLTDSNVLEKD